MKKIYFYSFLIMTGVWLSSCDADEVDCVDFGVTLSNDIQEIFAGEPVTFDFSGNPDYIVPSPMKTSLKIRSYLWHRTQRLHP